MIYCFIFIFKDNNCNKNINYNLFLQFITVSNEFILFYFSIFSYIIMNRNNSIFNHLTKKMNILTNFQFIEFFIDK